MATTRARDGGEDAVYRYLKWLAAAEADHELGRILYVGVTQACRRLHLVGVAKVGEDGQWRAPSSRSPLGRAVGSRGRRARRSADAGEWILRQCT